MAPERRHVSFAQGKTPPTSLQVFSVIEKVLGKPVFANNAAPIWGSSSFAGIPGLTFDGATQSLQYNSIATTLATGNDPSITVLAEVKCTSSNSNQTVFAFGSTTSSTPLLTCTVSSGSLILSETNANGTFTATYSSFDTNAHLITLVRTNALLVIRVDGVQVQTASLTPAFGKFNTFTIGAQNNISGLNNFFTGVIGKVLAYGNPLGGMADVISVEQEILLTFDPPATSASPPDFDKLLAWFEPTMVNIVGGVVVSAPNLAPNAPGPFTQTTSNWQPGWSATAVNGTPGIIGSPAAVDGGNGGGEKHLNGAIRPVLSGDVNGTAYTLIQALECVAPEVGWPTNAGFSCITSSTVDDGDSSAIAILMGIQNGDFADMYRYDTIGGIDDYATASSNVFPGVYTYMLDGVSGFVQRLNGEPFGTPFLPDPFSSGICAPQDAVGIGGQTDLDAGFTFGQDFCGNVGITLLFQGVLSESSLAYWENYVMGKTGLL